MFILYLGLALSVAGNMMGKRTERVPAAEESTVPEELEEKEDSLLGILYTYSDLVRDVRQELDGQAPNYFEPNKTAVRVGPDFYRGFMTWQ